MSTHAVEVENLTVTFDDHHPLDSLNLTIAGDEFVAIVGPNGAGKSTFLKTLLGLIHPAKGQVRIFGSPPHKVPPESIGYVPQMKTMDRSFPALSTGKDFEKNMFRLLLINLLQFERIHK